MGLRYEAWSPPWDPGGFKRKVAMLPAIDNTGQGTVGFLSLGGDSSVDISLADFDRLDDVVSDTETSLITVYDCAKDGTNTIIDEWIADRVPQDYVPSREVKLSGPRLLREAFDKALVYAFDYPKSPSVTRDHIWGKNQDDDSTGLIRNGTFEDVPMPNGGFEDGNAAYWQGTEDDGDLIANGSIRAISSPADARTGSWYGQVDPSGQGGGVKRSISGLVPGEGYTITGWINEDTGSGDRLRAGIIGASNAFHTNAYEEPIDPDHPGIWWAEIGNASQGNGASNGSWQSINLAFTPESDSVDLVIIYDDVNDRVFRIDDWSITGDNVGLDPWTPFANYNGVGTSLDFARHSTTQAHSGAGSAELQGEDGPYFDPFGRIGYGTFGISQDVRMVPGRLYTMTAWVRHNGAGTNGATERFRMVLVRKTPKGELDKTLSGDFLPGPGSYYMAHKDELIPQDTWTKIQMTVYADVSELGAQIRYAGTNVRNQDVGVFNSPTFWIDDVSIHEGLPATTIGDIWQTLLNDCTLNHANDTRGTVLEWIDYSSFDDVNDSNGNPWNEDIPFLARWGSTMSHVLDDTIDRGYEMELVRKTTPSGGKTHDFHLYNPGGRDNTPNTAIGSFQPLLGGDSLRRNPAYTSTLVASPQGAYTEDSDATSLADFGRMEKFEMDSEASGPVSRQLLSDNLLSYEQANRKAVRFKVVESDGVPRPGVDYKPGDTVAMSMPPGLAKEDRRVQSFDYVNSHPTQYVVVGSRVMRGEAAAFDLLERLWRRLQRPGETKDPPLGAGQNEGKALVIDVAASDAPDWEKAIARYQCSGTNDQEVIQAAIDEMILATNPFVYEGSRIQLSSGVFNINMGAVTFAGVEMDKGLLQGMGSSATILSAVATSGSTHDNPIIQLVSDHCTVRDLSLEGGAGNRVAGVRTDGYNSYVENCHFETNGPGLILDGNSIRVVGNLILGADGIIVATNTQNIVIVGNEFDGTGTPLTLGGNNDPIRVSGNIGIPDQDSEATSPSNISALSQPNTLSTGQGTSKLPFSLAAEIISVMLAVGTSPTGADLIVDVNKNGTTIFTTQANRPTVPDGDADGIGAEATPDVTSIAEGEYLTVDIDQVGSTIAGEDLTVVIEWRPT